MAQHTATTDDTVTTHAGWCPDCDLPSVVVDPRDGASAWAECVECGAGWVHRDELPDVTADTAREESRAA